MVTSLSQARLDPVGAAEALADGRIFGVRCVSGRLLPAEPSGPHGVVFDLVLAPLPALLAEGYPLEHLRLYVLPSDTVLVVDARPEPRTYKHRNPAPLTTLCLEYPRDSPALRLLPSDGLEAYVTCAYRHLMFEEAYRRGVPWPVEDAPHGDGRRPHPIVRKETRRAAAAWAR